MKYCINSSYSTSSSRVVLIVFTDVSEKHVVCNFIVEFEGDNNVPRNVGAYLQGYTAS
jgi:hypothetical protein